MPIITPAYPSMCATHNITYSTKKIILRELSRARGITNEIADGKLKWKDLFRKHTFFSEGYKYYLSVVAASRTKESQLMWSGLVESKVRRLVSGMEMSQSNVEIAHPFNKGFERIHRCRGDAEIERVQQGSLEYQAPDTKTETTDAINDPAHKAVAEHGESGPVPKTEDAESETSTKSNGEVEQTVYTTTYYVGIELVPGECPIPGSYPHLLIRLDSKSLDISYSVQEFKRTCMDWGPYDEAVNSIKVIHTRK